MTLDQKVGQMSQIDIDLMNTDSGTNFTVINAYNLGSVLIGLLLFFKPKQAETEHLTMMEIYNRDIVLITIRLQWKTGNN